MIPSDAAVAYSLASELAFVVPVHGCEAYLRTHNIHRFRDAFYQRPLHSNFAVMSTAAATPHLPNVSQRLAARVRPAGSAVMYQQWRDLLFLHWEYPAAEIQATLPEVLFVDTFGGKAYIAVVPFFTRDIRPWFLSNVPCGHGGVG